MNANDHDKIADKLLQYWGRMPNAVNVCNQSTKKAIYITQIRIDDLIKAIENLANCLEIEGFE